MMAVHALKDFVPFVQKLECFSRQSSYMYMIRRTIQNSVNYQLVRYFPDFPEASYGERILNYAGLDGATDLSTGVFC